MQTTRRKNDKEKDRKSLSSYLLVIKAFAKAAPAIMTAPKNNNILPLVMLMMPASEVSVRSLFKPRFFLK